MIKKNTLNQRPPIKVLLISEYFLPHKGGVESFVASIYKELNVRNFQCTILCGAFKGHKKFDLKERYHTKRVPIISIPRFYAMSFIISSRIFNRIKIGSFDIIHAHNPPSILAIKKTHKPTILTIHGDYANSFKFITKNRKVQNAAYILERKAVEKSTIVTCISKSITKKMKKRYPNKEIQYIPNYVDIDFFIPLQIAREKNHILFVGSLYKLKNVDLLIKAVHLLSKENNSIKLSIVGAGSQEKYLRRQVKKLKLTNKVFFLGLKDPKQLRILYNKVEMLVLPSSSEGAPMVLAEAMACQTPAISTDVGDALDIVLSKEYIIKSADSKSIAVCIKQNLQRNHDYNKIRSHIVKKFNKKRIIQSYSLLYKKLLTSN